MQLLVMVPLNQIYVDVAAEKLAETAGVDVKEAVSFLEAAGPLIRPAAVFDEVLPRDIMGPRIDSRVWGEQIIAGLLTLGPESSRAAETAPESEVLVRTFYSLALNDALDFIEYRIFRFLEPKGIRPGTRMIPGCPNLPVSVNQAIFNHFGPDNSLGLSPAPTGEIEDPTATAFIYPQSEKIAASQGCSGCSHKACPVRNAAAAINGKK